MLRAPLNQHKQTSVPLASHVVFPSKKEQETTDTKEPMSIEIQIQGWYILYNIYYDKIALGNMISVISVEYTQSNTWYYEYRAAPQ